MNPATITRHLAVMGTALSLAVSAPTREAALLASEAGAREIERIEALLSTWRDDSPLARLNAAAPGTPLSVPRELFALLKKIFEWSERTGGAFDPTVLPLVRAWGLRSGGRIPTPDELRPAMAATGPSFFSFEESSSTVVRRAALAGIDEGAWGKGFALDRAAAAMREAGATSAVLDLGGQLLAFGEEVLVDVAGPRDRSRAAARLRVKNASASTSGNSERSLVVNGHRVGHLLDPRTGSPARDFGSATVVAKDGLTADILSTAFFVLGPERGLALSERLRANGVAQEALFFLEGEEGKSLRALMSPGMTRLVDLAASPALAPTTPLARAEHADAHPPLSHSKKSSEGVHP